MKKTKEKRCAMNNITNPSSIDGIKIGTISVSVYKNNSGTSSFSINVENDNVIQMSYVIEDALKMY